MVNLIVLSHKDMRLTPFNRLLAGLAVADCLLSMEYIPFSLHMNIWDPESRDQQERVRIKRFHLRHPFNGSKGEDFCSILFSMFKDLSILNFLVSENDFA